MMRLSRIIYWTAGLSLLVGCTQNVSPPKEIRATASGPQQLTLFIPEMEDRLKLL